MGLRITETVKLDIRDRRPDLGEAGKLHIRFGKGSRGPRPRLVPAINSVNSPAVDRSFSSGPFSIAWTKTPKTRVAGTIPTVDRCPDSNQSMRLYLSIQQS